MLNDSTQTETNIFLWKYFTDDAAKIKDRMWTMASWMFTLQAGLLAFIAKHIIGVNCGSLRAENKVVAIVTCTAEK